jgi:hypothetical protein
MPRENEHDYGSDLFVGGAPRSHCRRTQVFIVPNTRPVIPQAIAETAFLRIVPPTQKGTFGPLPHRTPSSYSSNVPSGLDVTDVQHIR